MNVQIPCRFVETKRKYENHFTIAIFKTSKKNIPEEFLDKNERRRKITVSVKGYDIPTPKEYDVLINDNFKIIEEPSPQQAVDTITSLYLQAINDHGFENVVVLSPLKKKGVCATNSLNKTLQEAVNPPSSDKAEHKVGKNLFRVNDRVMQNKNITVLDSKSNEVQICNGDFFKDKSGRWNYNLFRFTSGILIPMMSIDRKIQGFQIRLDNPREGNKYLWFSSKNKAQGLSSGSPAHITNPLESNSNSAIYLTEGGLKADIACALSGKPFIGAAGVNNQSDLPELFNNLKQLGVKRIVDCFDRDCEYNVQVEKARRKLKSKVLKAGLIYTRMSWDNRFKGIDDYMAAHEKREWKFSVKE